MVFRCILSVASETVLRLGLFNAPQCNDLCTVPPCLFSWERSNSHKSLIFAWLGPLFQRVLRRGSSVLCTQNSGHHGETFCPSETILCFHLSSTMLLMHY